MLLNLMGEDEKLPVAGRVIWVTPKGAQGTRASAPPASACSSASRTAARRRKRSRPTWPAPSRATRPRIRCRPGIEGPGLAILDFRRGRYRWPHEASGPTLALVAVGMRGASASARSAVRRRHFRCPTPSAKPVRHAPDHCRVEYGVLDSVRQRSHRPACWAPAMENDPRAVPGGAKDRDSTSRSLGCRTSVGVTEAVCSAGQPGSACLTSSRYRLLWTGWRHRWLRAQRAWRTA